MDSVKDRYVKTCPTCGKRKVAEIGFYKDPTTKDGYYYQCKKCKDLAQKKSNHKKRGNELINHLWDAEDVNNISICKRCGVQRIKKAKQFPVRGWYYMYFIDTKWIYERPECIFHE